MSSLYLDGTFRISQEILKLRHSIQKAVHQHGFLLYIRTAVPLTATINIPSRTTSYPRRCQQLHSHFFVLRKFSFLPLRCRALLLIYFHKRQHDRRQRHEQRQKPKLKILTRPVAASRSWLPKFLTRSTRQN